MGVGVIPGLLAAKLPMRRMKVSLDRKLAFGLQTVGIFALFGGLIWLFWLLPQLFMSTGCWITSGVLMVLTLFTVSLSCQTSLPMWINIAEGLIAFGVAFLTYGTTRRVVLARPSPKSSVLHQK